MLALFRIYTGLSSRTLALPNFWFIDFPPNQVAARRL